jgi:hypothetical protein
MILAIHIIWGYQDVTLLSGKISYIGSDSGGCLSTQRNAYSGQARRRGTGEQS